MVFQQIQLKYLVLRLLVLLYFFVNFLCSQRAMTKLANYESFKRAL